MADFEWDWPDKIERADVDAALDLDFLERGRNLVLVAAEGLGKTMIARNIIHNAILAGSSALFISAAELLLDLGGQESARGLDRRLEPSGRDTAPPRSGSNPDAIVWKCCLTHSRKGGALARTPFGVASPSLRCSRAACRRRTPATSRTWSEPCAARSARRWSRRASVGTSRVRTSRGSSPVPPRPAAEPPRWPLRWPVSASRSARDHWGNPPGLRRAGSFAWYNNVSGATTAHVDDLAARLAAAVAGVYGTIDKASRACSPSGAYTWCACTLSQAAFNTTWSTYTRW